MPNISTVDDELIEAMRNRNQDALGRIVEKYTPYIGTIVWNIVRDKLSKSDAEEILSDVFSALWYNADKVRDGKLKSYLSAIARRRALNALRSTRHEMPLEDSTIQLPVSGPEEESIRQAEYAVLRKILNELPEPDRTIFIRHYYFYQTTAEIAKALGINVNTVQMKLWRGRDRLRRELTEGGYFIE